MTADRPKSVFFSPSSVTTTLFDIVSVVGYEKQKEEQAKLGCAPAQKLFEMVNVELIDEKKPPHSFVAYKKIDFADIKSKALSLGVEAIEML